VSLLLAARLCWSLAWLAAAALPGDGLELWVQAPAELAPGAEALLRVVARLTSGDGPDAPVTGARVEVWLERGAEDRRRLAVGVTGPRGGFEARVRAPGDPGPARAALLVLLAGPAGTALARQPLLLRPAARLALQLERRAVRPGEALGARVVLRSSPDLRPLVDAPVRLRLLGPGELSAQDLRTGPGGVAVARLALPADAGWVRVRVEAEGAQPAERWLHGVGSAHPPPFTSGPAEGAPGLEFEPDAGRRRAGQPLRLRLAGPAALATAYLAPHLDGRPLASLAVPLRAGAARAELVLGPGWEGPVELVASGPGPCGRTWRVRRMLYVEPAAPLEVTVLRARPVEEAGRTVRLGLEVRDAAGRPRQAWIGVTAVAAARAEALPEAGWDGGEVPLPPAGPAPVWGAEAAARWRADPACDPERLAERWPPAAAELHEPRRARIAAALLRYGEENRAWFRLDVWEPARQAWAPPDDVLGRLALRGLLPSRALLDAWGRPLEIAHLDAPRGAGPLRYLALRSRGADGLPGGGDDLELPLAGPGAPTPAAAPGGPPLEAARTLLFAPDLRTDAQGALELTLSLPAEGESCWLQILAHAEDGAVGLARHHIRIRPR